MPIFIKVILTKFALNTAFLTAILPLLFMEVFKETLFVFNLVYFVHYVGI